MHWTENILQRRLKDLMKLHSEECSGTTLLNPQKQSLHLIRL